MNSTLRLPLLFLCVVSTNLFAYEQATHALLTSRAFDSSTLSGSVDGFSPLIKQLGLDTFEPFGTSETYLEIVTAPSGNRFGFPHVSQTYERNMVQALFGNLGIPDPTKRWLVYGAIREDDNPEEDPPTPQDVAPGLQRPLRHFYDPVFDRPLTSGISLGQKAVDWAIGSSDSFSDPNAPQKSRLNSFTIIDARDAMFKALTLMTKSNDEYVQIAPNETAEKKQQLRQAYWTTTFRAVGNVLHLNQDMAQPQHTRNEPHSGKYCPTSGFCKPGHTSVYEKYMNGRVLRQHAFDSLYPFNKHIDIQAIDLVLTGYPIPAFGKYTDYWSTAPKDKEHQGKGLADYSNHGFFTAAKNLGDFEYSSPSNYDSNYNIRTTVPTRWDGSSISDATPLYVYYGRVRDELQQYWDANVPLTTFSLWDQFLKSKSVSTSYSLNRLNYDAMANLLLPRAVAYSAGLINFFFRGQIEISLPKEGVFAVADHSTKDGFKKLRATIKNITPLFANPEGTPQPQNMDGGTFFAVVRYHKDKKYVDGLDTVVGAAPCSDYMAVFDASNPGKSTDCRDGVEQIIVSKPVDDVSLDAGDDQTVDFDFSDSPIPFGMTDVVLQIVYRGPLGSEADAVAVGTMDISEPTYFTYHNASDYIHIGEHVYTRGEIEADVTLLAAVRPQYCVNYQLSPPKLRDGCLELFDIDLKLSFEDVSKPLVEVTKLSARRFIRIAYLEMANEPFNPPVKARVRRLKIEAHPHAKEGKALLNQESPCLPIDPFDIPPRHEQMVFASLNQYSYRVDPLSKLRGVNGWYNTSCVVNGDDAQPGTSDQRKVEMLPLVPETEEVTPFPVTINEEYLPDPT